MNRYVSLMALWFWILIGKDKSSMIKYVRITFANQASKNADY